MIYEENTKEIMRVKESVYPSTEFCLFSQILTLIFSPYIRCIFKIASQIGA